MRAMTKEGRTMKMTSYQNQYHNLDYKKGRNSPYYDLEYGNILENNTLSIDSASDCVNCNASPFVFDNNISNSHSVSHEMNAEPGFEDEGTYFSYEGR